MLNHLNFWASLVLIAITMFLIFKGYLKSQVEKNSFFEIRDILYGNYKEKLLWFNAFFAEFEKIYTHKLFNFLTFF